MEQVVERERREILRGIRIRVGIGMVMFLTVVAGVIIGHLTAGTISEFTSDHFSISRYMGLTHISAFLFLTCNLFLALEFVKIFHLVAEYRCGQKMPVRELPREEKLRFALGCIIAGLLVTLSVCPVGLYDGEWGNFGAVSVIHQVSSRTMFALMGVYAASTAVMEIKKRGRVFWVNAGFAAYVLSMIFCFLVLPEFFWAGSFYFEMVYLYFFFVVLLVQ